MLMSLFSSLEAVCAESCGQKDSLSWSPANKEAARNQGGGVIVSEPPPAAAAAAAASSFVDGLKKGEEGISSSSSSSSVNGQKVGSKQQRRPRVAVELDGVHCFETIIPY